MSEKQRDSVYVGGGYKRVYGGKPIKNVRRYDYVDVEERSFKARYFSMPFAPHKDACILYMMWMMTDHGYGFFNDQVQDRDRKAYDGTFLQIASKAIKEGGIVKRFDLYDGLERPVFNNDPRVYQADITRVFRDWCRLKNVSPMNIGYLDIRGESTGVNSDNEILLIEVEKDMYHVYLIETVFNKWRDEYNQRQLIESQLDVEPVEEKEISFSKDVADDMFGESPIAQPVLKPSKKQVSKQSTNDTSSNTD